MTNIEHELLQSFLNVFREKTGASIADVSLEVPTGDVALTHLDALVEVRLPNGDKLRLAVELMRAAYPRDVRITIDRLQKVQRVQEGATPVKCVVVAEVLSPGARAALRKQQVSYFDTSGTLFFEHGTWVVDIERTPKHRPRKPATLFTGAREQVVHGLLEHWRLHGGEEFISGIELANLTKTSAYTVSLTMQELEREDLVETMGSGPRQRRRLRDAAGLLDAWAQAWKLRRDPISRYFAFAPPRAWLPDVLLEKLAGRTDWALTGAAAANAVVPHLTSVDRVEVIVPPGRAEVWADELGFKRVEKGANVVFIEREGASMMFLDTHPERPGSFFASRYIQYLDLLNGYGRNKELAQEFRRRALHMEPSK